MKALQFTEYGGPEVITVAEVPEPHAGPGQIRVAVKAAGVNPVDWKTRSGMYAGGKPLDGPRGLGFDAAGVVDEVGEGVTGVRLKLHDMDLALDVASELAQRLRGPYRVSDWSGENANMFRALRWRKR